MPTTTVEGNGNPPDTVASPTKATRLSNLFPQHRLESAVAVAEVIESANAGQPYPPTDIAIALGKSPGSSGFHTLLSSSLKYGLTVGSYKADRITQTTLGQSVTAPTNAEERQHALVRAALTPTTFSKAYAYYKGKKLPDTQYLMNTFVREFGIPQDQAENCSDIFRANLHFVGLIREASTGLWVSGAAGVEVASMTDDAEVDTDGGVDSSSGERTPEVPVGITPPESPIEAGEKPQRPRAIFVGHGKDKGPLTQLEKILSEYKLPYKVAKYEPNAGRPIRRRSRTRWVSAVQRSFSSRPTRNCVTSKVTRCGVRPRTSDTSWVQRACCTTTRS